MSPVPDRWLPPSPVHREVADAGDALRLAEAAAELDRAPAFPRAIFREFGRRRLLGLSVPEGRGGRGLSLPEAGAGLYELAYVAGATTFAKLALQPEFSSVLGETGGPALLEEYYRPLCRGELLVGNQLTEPAAGSDLRALACLARPEGDGYRLSGTKSEAAFAVDADAAIVYARVPERPGAEGGTTAFLVPQHQPGIEGTEHPDLGERWMRRGSVVYRDVRVPAGHRLGPEGAGLSAVVPELHRERGLLAMVYLGVARRTLEELVEYAGAREAFGRPLARHEAVAFPIAQDWAELEAATLYALEVLRCGASGTPVEGPAAMAKWMATELSLRVHDHAIQFHGGRGYSNELPFERRWRDVRSGRLAHGTSEIMQVTAGRTLWPGPRRGTSAPPP